MTNPPQPCHGVTDQSDVDKITDNGAAVKLEASDQSVNTPLRECINCQSAWPEDSYRLSDGAVSNVCQACGLERMAERERQARRKPNARTQTATVNALRSPAIPKAGVCKITAADGTITYQLPKHSRLPRHMRT